MLLAMAMVKHSGWHGHRAPVTYFHVQFQHQDKNSAAFQQQYKSAIEREVGRKCTSDQTQNLQTLQNQLMELGHFQSAKIAIAAPQMVHISVVTGERLFDVTPSLLAGSDSLHQLYFEWAASPWPRRSRKPLSLPVLDVSTKQRPLNCRTSLLQHAKAQGWSSFIDEIREPNPNQIELLVTDASGTQGLVDFRSTPSHEAGTEPVFALKLKILDKQAMVYRSLTPGGGHWRIEPRGMVRRPSA